MKQAEAQKMVETTFLSAKEDVVLIPDATEEFESCFAFYFQGKAFVESGDVNGFYVGHGPILVSKATGELFETGSARTTQQYVKAFSCCGDPFADLTKRVLISGWHPGARKVSTTKLIKRVSGLGLKDAKHIVDQVLQGHSSSFTAFTTEEASRAVEEITSYGFECKQLWSNQ